MAVPEKKKIKYDAAYISYWRLFTMLYKLNREDSLICDEAPATQIDNLIEFDSNKYIIKIIAGKEYEKSLLKEVARVCACNVLEAKKILENTGFEFWPMDALDARALKHKLDDIGVNYAISPEFRW